MIQKSFGIYFLRHQIGFQTFIYINFVKIKQKQRRKKHLLHFSQCVFSVNQFLRFFRILIPDVEVNLVPLGLSSSTWFSRELIWMRVTWEILPEGEANSGTTVYRIFSGPSNCDRLYGKQLEDVKLHFLYFVSPLRNFQHMSSNEALG